MTFRIILVVSESTITGVIEATLYGAKAATRFDFWTDVKFFPVVDLTDIKTFPYSGVDETPVDTS